MIVKSIQLINFKNISEFRADFTKGIYLITGENDKGKSNLISSIITCLTGNRSSNLLKQGEEKGSVEMEVGDENTSYTLELRYSDKNPRGTIYIKDPNGMESSNLSMLQKIFQYTDFDAHEFVAMSTTAEGRRKQSEIVKSLIPEEILEQIRKIENSLPTMESERTEWGRKIKDLDGAIKEMGITKDDVDFYDKPIDVVELNAQIDKGYHINNEITRKKEDLDATTQSLEGWDKQVENDLERFDNDGMELEEQIQKLKAKQEELIEQRKMYIKKVESDKAEKEKYVKTLQADLQKLTPVSIESLREQANKAADHNRMYDKVQEYKRKQDLLSKAAKTRQEIDDNIKAARAEKEQLIKSADLPIEGLTFEEDGLAINGIPFKPGEVSTSQEIEIATRLIIAMNPKMKVFKVMNGESIGAEKFKALVAFAKKNGYQGFIEEMHRGQNELAVEEYNEK